MSFAQWLEDFRWAMNVKRARAFRRELGFRQRAAFDKALRPGIDTNVCIDYPDAIYYITINDLCRAMDESRRYRRD